MEGGVQAGSVHPTRPKQVWSLYFVTDQQIGGSKSGGGHIMRAVLTGLWRSERQTISPITSRPVAILWGRKQAYKQIYARYLPAQWHDVVPESVAVSPAMGMNCQS